MKVDAVIVGAGISGLQSALDLADQGRKVVLVEKKSSIGGRMINLSKVYPTLDCASCITTPRMSSVANHPNITCYTYSEVKSVDKLKDSFKIIVRKKPRYIIEDDCIGCKRCEDVCPVYIPDDFEHNLGAMKAISIPFTNAIPQLPVLIPEKCTLCGACAKVCPKDCIDFLQKEEEVEINCGALILSTGFHLTPKNAKTQYGGGQLKNVLTSLEAERLLAPHGPFGRVLRPSDGKRPDSIAFVQCAGSRDKSIGVPYCSRVCCMYAIKQAMLLSGSLPIADITIYYMDIRAFGKGYEQFYQNAKAMGIQFVKAKVGRIEQAENDDLTVHIERQEADSPHEEVHHDMVILSLGLLPEMDKQEATKYNVDLASDGFIDVPESPFSPTKTKVEGIFAAGTAIGPKDIVDTIAEACSASMEAEKYLKEIQWSTL